MKVEKNKGVAGIKKLNKASTNEGHKEESGYVM